MRPSRWMSTQLEASVHGGTFEWLGLAWFFLDSWVCMLDMLGYAWCLPQVYILILSGYFVHEISMDTSRSSIACEISIGHALIAMHLGVFTVPYVYFSATPAKCRY